jgi:hypothetical protein
MILVVEGIGVVLMGGCQQGGVSCPPPSINGAKMHVVDIVERTLRTHLMQGVGHADRSAVPHCRDANGAMPEPARSR